MNVLVITEDFRTDAYIIGPIVTAILRAIGNTTAKVKILRDPLMGAVETALNARVLAEVVERYRGMTHLFLLLVDRDGSEGRRDRLAQIEEWSQQVLGADQCMMAECAFQEVEVWALAGIKDLPSAWRWDDVRACRDPKEIYFNEFAKLQDIGANPGGGRKELGVEAGKNIKRVLQLCPELHHLKSRIAEFVETRSSRMRPFAPLFPAITTA